MNSKVSSETNTRNELIVEARVNTEEVCRDSDITKSFVQDARKTGLVAWDIETSGLDWRSERIGLCQLWIPDRGLSLIKMRKKVIPQNLAILLEDSSVKKIFHHAMFDLRFLCYHWGAQANNVACTKIASKLLTPEQPNGHSLSALLEKYFKIKIDKSNRKSDWLAWDLSHGQVEYAKADVVYLPQLLSTLEHELKEQNLLDLALDCFSRIPAQVTLDIRGYKDVYGY
jgi:ribonuclease D